MRAFVARLNSTLLPLLLLYLYENRMFTSIVRRNIVWGGKGKDRVALIKSLIHAIVGRGA